MGCYCESNARHLFAFSHLSKEAPRTNKATALFGHTYTVVFMYDAVKPKFIMYIQASLTIRSFT